MPHSSRRPSRCLPRPIPRACVRPRNARPTQGSVKIRRPHFQCAIRKTGQPVLAKQDEKQARSDLQERRFSAAGAGIR